MCVCGKKGGIEEGRDSGERDRKREGENIKDDGVVKGVRFWKKWRDMD